MDDRLKIIVRNTIIHILLYLLAKMYFEYNGIALHGNLLVAILSRRLLMLSIFLVSYLEINYKK